MQITKVDKIPSVKQGPWLVNISAEAVVKSAMLRTGKEPGEVLEFTQKSTGGKLYFAKAEREGES